ncbi:MAG: peptidylprolyl isomerase [Holosporales bacterium]|jgi:parvulin-like peptidyl-prolyl isomerase/glutaredoxin|nr:peptidylprolyl isomerase [Holosporales bacterium]
MISYLRYCLFFPFIFNVASSEPVKVSSIGRSTDESFIYKNKPKKNTIYNDENNVFSVLKNTKTKTGKTAQNQISKNIENREIFVVAEVNDKVITNVDILTAIRFIFFLGGKGFNKKHAKLMIPSVLNIMIDETLQQQLAKLSNIIVSDNDINERIAEIASENGLSVNDLVKQFQEAGISMKIFRRYIRLKMTVSIVAQMLASDIKISKNDMNEARAKAAGEIKKKRYLISEIVFRVDDKADAESIRKNAESVLNLIKDGFSFQLIAETLSQGEQLGDRRNTRWSAEETLEQPVREAIKDLSPGKCSGIIKTKIGYKIVCFLDVAEPGKVGTMNGTYKILQSSIQFGGALFTEKDNRELETKIEKIKNAKSVEEYKTICKENGIQFEEAEIKNPNGYELSAISQSKSSKSPVIFPSPEKENTIDIIMLVGEKCEDAKVPDDKIIRERLSAEKFEKEFITNFRKLKTVSRIVVNTENLRKISQ